MTKKIYAELEDPYVMDEDFYTEEEIGLLLEDDEISSVEAAFMQGYIDGE